MLPVVVCLSGNDPSGGAGLAADITAIQAQACHACPVPTALTVQDTCNVREIIPVDAGLIERQVRAVLADVRVAAFKIGICGSAENAGRIAALVAEYPGIPVILDPVIHASGGFEISRQSLLDVLRDSLVPATTILVPNQSELMALSPEAENLRAAAESLLKAGCRWVLITTGDGTGDPVTNLLLGADGSVIESSWPRLDAQFHGSGCTLAASLAAQIALGLGVPDAAQRAQEYTWNCLQRAVRTGAGRLIPLR